MSRHLQEETMAAFIEGSLSQIDRAGVHTHLQCCESCFEAYQYAVRFHAIRPDERRDAAVPPGHLVHQVESLAGRKQRARARGAFSSPWRVAALPAVAALFVVAVWWGTPDGQQFDPNSAALSPITGALNDASSRQDMLLPGANKIPVEGTRVFRSGTVQITQGIDASLALLNEKVIAGDASHEETSHLISGYLAVGLTDNARTLLRQLESNDAEMLNLRAIVAYRDGKLERARDLLLQSIKLNETAAACLNLGVVYRDLGEKELAETSFTMAAELSTEAGIDSRAITQIKKLDN
jgi:tetratricopeptide (TPR) repeat protein